MGHMRITTSFNLLTTKQNTQGRVFLQTNKQTNTKTKTMKNPKHSSSISKALPLLLFFFSPDFFFRQNT
ncbi:hypothetical protein EUTSA_v10010047mg [Eutrema salsugineum]|uniref:Uncharacterized protein n=1 Tax=Eutrema salsugineum TaxID=72664 RepID=V4MSX1_EUTSA|nr:hypothetical protein EUTSA_v10010047mg [Eutrema salsugineum]